MDLNFSDKGYSKVSIVKHVNKCLDIFQKKLSPPPIFQQRITSLISVKKATPWSYQSNKPYNYITR